MSISDEITVVDSNGKRIIACTSGKMLKLTDHSLHMKYRSEEGKWVRLNFDFEDLIIQNEAYLKIFPVKVSLKSKEERAESENW